MSAGVALLLIDAQVNMFDAAFPVADAVALLERLRALLERARATGTPAVFVRNSGGAGNPDEPGGPGWALHPELSPREGEPVLDKTTCNTFASTTLAELLRARGVTNVVIAGLQSDYCVRETTLGALALGFAVTLVSDGHSTYDNKGRSASAIRAAVNDEFSPRARLTPAGAVSFGA